MSTVRTRFAPSPTGMLHLGGARTALFAWAFARHHEGTFILRIEDTDVERSTPEAVQVILDSMRWLGLDYDEGPFFQMQHTPRYREVVQQMLAAGLAYRCYTTSAELDALRAEQQARGEKPRYDGRWRPDRARGRIPPKDVPPVVRFINPVDGVVRWHDEVKGTIEIANTELDDLVIERSDGTPTYNFSVVVDDIDMRITHVVRGDDHVNNTPRQINLMRALGAEPPVYAHLPTVLGADGQKLSKRHGAVGVMEYADSGILPEALDNFLARLGWAHGDEEIFTLEDLVAWFDLKHINPAPARFDGDKLRWVNHEHMKRASPAFLGAALVPFLVRAGLDPAAGPAPADVAALLRERVHTLAEMAAAATYFYRDVAPTPALLGQHVKPRSADALADLDSIFAGIEWRRETIAASVKSAAARLGLKAGEVMMPLRVLVAGTVATPAIDAVLELVGRERTRERIRRGLSDALGIKPAPGA